MNARCSTRPGTGRLRGCILTRRLPRTGKMVRLRDLPFHSADVRERKTRLTGRRLNSGSIEFRYHRNPHRCARCVEEKIADNQRLPDQPRRMLDSVRFARRMSNGVREDAPFRQGRRTPPISATAENGGETASETDQYPAKVAVYRIGGDIGASARGKVRQTGVRATYPVTGKVRCRRNLEINPYVTRPTVV